MTDRTAADLFGALTTRPPLDPELASGRLFEAGVSVDLHMWGGAFHGFDMSLGHAAVSRASNATREEFIRRALGGEAV